MNKSTFEQELQKNGRLIYKVSGFSMSPLLRENRDLVVIEAGNTDRYRKYDVVLYKVKDRYVLHRILKVREQDYVLCGDRCTKKEYGVRDDQILGVMTAFVRDGKTISTRAFRYRLYTHLWCDFFYLRVAVIEIGSLIHRLFRKG